MADTQTMERALPLDGAFGGSAVARLSVAKPATRLSLRARFESVTELSAQLGIELPTKPLASSAAGERLAFWLGPDEWLVIDESGSDLPALLGPAAGPYAAVDVSHRNVAIIVEGPGATDALNTACPMDLRPQSFPVGKVARTVLGKADIIVYRMGDESFRIECWRSFAPYVFGLLDVGACDATF